MCWWTFWRTIRNGLAGWSIAQLRAQSKIYRLAINPIIYSELSLTFSTVEGLDRTIDELGLTLVELSRPTANYLAKSEFTARMTAWQRERTFNFVAKHPCGI